MQSFDNVNHILKDDLAVTLKKGSKLSIAAACFSIYAYQALKEQLEEVDELRFIFTSPAFVTEKITKEKREFYIPRLSRERSLYGTEFEVKLRNELSQKAIAKECADWIRRKVCFRSNRTNMTMNNHITVTTTESRDTYMPINGFTSADLGCGQGNRGFITARFGGDMSNDFIKRFNELWQDADTLQDVTDEIIDSITVAYKENSASFLYFFTLYNIFTEFLEDITEDILPNEATGFKESVIWNRLYAFQKDAVLAIISKLEQYNGCILADSVGLGKTFSALAVIKYYESRNRNVLVLCPKKLADNWSTFRENYKNNPVANDRLRYDILFHTDLSRSSGLSGNIDLEKLNWGNYDLVVIDESHNFRNGGIFYGEEKRKNRYQRLLDDVIRPGVKTKVLMLSATPVNNRFTDLQKQLELAYEGVSNQINAKLNTAKPIEKIFQDAQRVFDKWSRREPEERLLTNLLQELEFDFFEVLDSVTIARSRKHIEKYYDCSEIGTFPERLKPITKRPSLTDLPRAINYNEIFCELSKLSLSVYTPMAFVHQSKIEKYINNPENRGDILRIKGLEKGILSLMTTNLLKRLESSVHSFRLTISRIKELIEQTIQSIDDYEAGKNSVVEATDFNEKDFDYDDQNTDFFAYGKLRRLDFADMDYISWRETLQQDAEILELLYLMVADIKPKHDSKLQELLTLIAEKVNNPINADNKKILIFSAFSETVEYLYSQVSLFAKERFGLDVAMVTGSVEGKTTIAGFKATLNNVLTCFSPISKDKALLMPENLASIDILIGTDCISEGQNLQDCDFCVNYDIHWNPVRIIQRFGRIDRIGSKNEVIQLVNFWPDLSLDEYINLKSRVETRMKISVMTSTGDDDFLNTEEKGDLEYRRAQLERLQNEVVDIEEMQTGISIMDLGLNEFRLDLLDYIKNHGDLDKTPNGLHAIIPASKEAPAGVIFVLKNINGGVNIDNQNRIHPFYMVYLQNNGDIACDHLAPKEMLDKLRLLCKGKDEPQKELCQAFNKETKEGKKMQKYSDLLGKAISSMIHVKEQSDIESLFKPGHTTALNSNFSGLDDFELICFFIVQEA